MIEKRREGGEWPISPTLPGGDKERNTRIIPKITLSVAIKPPTSKAGGYGGTEIRMNFRSRLAPKERVHKKQRRNSDNPSRCVGPLKDGGALEGRAGTKKDQENNF